jgi:hypothetical protein
MICLMAKSSPHLPAPQAQAFVICREIWHNDRSNEFLLASPLSHIPIDTFPAVVTVSVYAHITGGHGEYELDFLLRNSSNDTVWSWIPQSPLQHEDPLMPQQVAFHDLVLEVPSPGRYELALLANGDEIGRQPMIFGTRDILDV